LVGRIDESAFGYAPIGGEYDWDANTLGIIAGIKVIDPGPNVAAWGEIDRRVDDGNTSTGSVRIFAGSHFMFILNE
jgi:hypothetical protein